ncbi:MULTISPECIES: hypothetical protein [Carnobacterium]|uniref:Uncharacterized protein n=1 Tax=Carnobacterium antarcticum TaxID=2126436 RepID=A0ABW4NQX7_9LACT|nr:MULTISPECIES: hypothetical protein [unclassified Carnobacterium]ALV21391.1 Capsular polysaccharide synthesis enzyme Cap8I [Carnobacterium sp. CP1]QQP69402.1 hypothetical protein JHE06_07160 [Carnobacterium sp. CS13]
MKSLTVPTATDHFSLSINKDIFVFIGLAAAFLTIDPQAVPGYQWQFLLPLFFSIFYKLFAPPIKAFSMGYLVLNGIWLIRYCITPVLIKISHYQIRYETTVSVRHLNMALILMVVELVVSILASSYFYSKIKKTSTTMELPVEQGKLLKINGLNTKSMNPSLVLGMAGLSLLVIVLDPNALNGFNFIFDTVFLSKDDSTFGMSVLIIAWTKIIVTVYLIELFGDREKQSEDKKNLWFSMLVVLVSLSFFNGTSRNMIFIEAFAYIYLLIRVFPKHKKSILTICLSSLVFILVLVSIVRFNNTRNISEGLSSYDTAHIAQEFSVYFEGQQNIALGIKSLDFYGDKYTVLTLFKDLLENTIYFNRFVASIPSTVQMFNTTLYGHSLWADQIPPTITQAIGLLGALGVLVPALFVSLVLKLDRLATQKTNVFGIFLAIFVAVNIAFFSPGSITIISTAVTNRFIPLYVLYKASLTKF